MPGCFAESGGTELVEEVISRMKADLKADKANKVSWNVVFKKWLRVPLIIAIGIMFVQQFTGINTIIYYSPKIFLMSGLQMLRQLFGHL